MFLNTWYAWCKNLLLKLFKSHKNKNTNLRVNPLFIEIKDKKTFFRMNPIFFFRPVHIWILLRNLHHGLWPLIQPRVSPQASSSSTLPNIRDHAHAPLAPWRLGVIEQPHHVPLRPRATYRRSGSPAPARLLPRTISPLSTLLTPKFQPHVLSCAIHSFDKMPKRDKNASQCSRQNQMKIDVAAGRLAYKQCGWWRQGT
jgi:hypothetical protein